VEASCSVCGAPPSSWKESGKVVALIGIVDAFLMVEDVNKFLVIGQEARSVSEI
jgi:hypothetical protein